MTEQAGAPVTAAEVAAAYRRLPAPAQARQLRIDCGVDATQLAAEIGVHPVTVYRWEKGLRRPHGRDLVAYSAALAELRAAAVAS